MGPRYAVLWSVDGAESIEIGIAVERADHVLVDVPGNLCVPARQRGEYQVMQPDGSLVVYRPGDEGYFDQVLIDLSRTFAIGEQDRLVDGEKETIARALQEKVNQQIITKRRARYRPRTGRVRYRSASTPIAKPTHAAERVAVVA